MSVTLAHIYRHPIKAHGREALASVVLSAGAALPWDRHWAVAHERSRFDAMNPGWTSCGNFQRGAKVNAVMAIEATFDEATGRMQLTHPQRPPLDFFPEMEGERLIEWLRPICGAAAFAPKALVRAPGVAMTDSDYPTISVMNLASNAAVGAALGTDLSIHRWRGNLWLDGLAPWEEFGWIGRRLRIGKALLEVRERISRCKATTVNPATGIADLDTLSTLRSLVGEQHFGVYAVVVEPGAIAPGDQVELV